MSNNLVNIIYNFFTQCPTAIQPVHQPMKRLLEKGDFQIYYDDKIKNYLVKVYVGNQKVDMILDTTQIEILVPTTCCAYRGCLDVHQYGVYDFTKSSTCDVILPNKAQEKCNINTCDTISTLEHPMDRTMVFDFGVINKATAFDYVSFTPDIKKTGKIIRPKTKIQLVLGFHTPYATFIPPTLGIGLSNIMDLHYIYLDLQNNILSFDKIRYHHPKYELAKSMKTYYSSFIDEIYINAQILKQNVPWGLIIDSGVDTIAVPRSIHGLLVKEIKKMSNVPNDSVFWKNHPVQLNTIHNLVLPNITLSIPTIDNKFYNWTLRKEDYVIKNNNKYIFGIILNQDGNNFRLGNKTLKNKKIGLMNDKNGNSNISIY